MQVAIANPRLGGARRTSVRNRAAEMRQTLREEAREFAVNRGGILFWNGAKDPSAMFRPGEVRS